MNKGRVVIIHGVHFRKKDKDNLRRLACGFRAAGFCVSLPSYGFVHPIVAGLFQWIDRRIADTMSSFIRQEDILVGHSNGATLVYLISQINKVRGAVLINPALDSGRLPNAEFVHIYHNSGDWINRIGAIFPFHPWGDMGADGYTGTDHRATNFDQSNTPGMPTLDGHSDVFKRGNIRPWSRFMADRCVEELELLSVTKWSNDHD